MNLESLANRQLLEQTTFQRPEKLNHIYHKLAPGSGTVQERREALKEAARDFESIFINQMISAMRKTVHDGGLVKKSSGEKIYESMLDEEWSKKLAGKSGSGGLSEMLYQQLSRRFKLDEEDAPSPLDLQQTYVPLHPNEAVRRENE